jgi:membrane-associated phospholipid phosphatase
VLDRRAALHPASRILREVAIIGVAFLAYMSVRALTSGARDVALNHAGDLLRWEQDLNLDLERGAQQVIASSGVGRRVVNTVYVWTYWPMVLLALVATWRYRRSRYRMLRDALVISGAVGLVFFATFPVAPPRMLDGFTDTVSAASRQHFVAHPSGLVNPYAAFPSFHIGWYALALWVLCWRRSTWAALVAALGTVAMAVAVVATGNHFVFDVLGGLTICGLALLAAYRLERRRAARTSGVGLATDVSLASGLPATGRTGGWRSRDRSRPPGAA